MNTDHDVREFLDRMAREPAIGPVDPEPILRRAHRRLARTAVLGFACVALVAGVAIGGANLVLSSPPVPATPNPTDGDLPLILRDGEVMIQDFDSGRLEALDPSTGDRRTILDCEDRCRFIASRAISADGRWLAYEVGCGDACPPETGIWVTNALGDEQRLTETCTRNMPCYPQAWAWSPQGSTLAASQGGEVSRLFTIDLRTGEDRTTVASPSTIYALAWSPDGTGIVYATTGLEWVDLESGETTELADVLPVDSIAWSPDGTRIVVDEFQGRGSRIIVMNADGSDQRVLVEQPRGYINGGSYPAWSPDSTSIAYASTSGDSLEVWVIGADGSSATRLFHGECCHRDWQGLGWSPDGSRIAFHDHDDSWLVVDADGTGSPEPIDETEVLTW